MKKLLALLIVLTMVIGILPVVNAAIPQNNGLGTVLEFVEWTRNSPSGSPWIGRDLPLDETFGTVERHIINGSDETKSGKGPYTTYKGFLKYNITSDVTINASDKVFISFYYRINTNVNGEAYTTPKGLYVATNTAHDTSGGVVLDTSVTDTWVYYSAIKNIHTSPKSTTDLRQFTGIYTNNVTDKVCIDIAEPTAIYFDAVTAEGDVSANDQITSVLSTTAITSLTVGGTNVDLTANPTSYTVEEDISAEDVAVTTRYGTAEKVIIEKTQDGKAVVVKVYAPMVDWTAANAQPSLTYNVNIKQKEPVSVTVTENNGYGTGVIGGLQTPVVVDNTGKAYSTFETVKGDSAAPFDEYYTWAREAFTVEGTNNTSYLNFTDVSGGVEGKAGDWVYVSLYYRAYNRFKDSNGNTVDGNTVRVYPIIRTGGRDISLKTGYANSSSTTYFDMIADSTSADDMSEWVKYTFITKLTADTTEDWALKLSSPYTKNSTDGTVSNINKKIDIADVKVAYFGTPTVLNAESDAEAEAAIKEAIAQAAGNYGLSGVYINGEAIDTVSIPLNYTVSAPRLTAREKVFDITGNTIHGAGMAYVSETDDVYTIKALPLDYDWLSGTDNRVATYTVTDIREYDFYDFELEGTTFTLKADNGLTSAKTGVLIGATYDSNGSLLNIKAEPFSITGKANTLSVTVPESNKAKSMKVFIWDGLATSKPFVKTINISKLSDGKITQE